MSNLHPNLNTGIDLGINALFYYFNAIGTIMV